MNILVTGAKGFVGKNLVQTLKTIRDGKNRTHELSIGEIFEYDLDTDPAMLDVFCEKADFVFHLAGVNRPKDQSEFMAGNFGFTSTLLDALKRKGNTCPVMLSSSIQATLIGRYGQSDYGRSKLAGEELFFAYAQRPALRCWCTVSPTCSASGAAPTITLRWQPSATIRPMICPLRSMTRQWNWNFSTSTI